MKKPVWTCEELGVCRSPGNCTECRKAYPFAPGAIERMPRRRWLTDRRVEQLARAALVLTLMTTLAATVGFVAGYLSPSVAHVIGGVL